MTTLIDTDNLNVVAGSELTETSATAFRRAEAAEHEAPLRAARPEGALVARPTSYAGWQADSTTSNVVPFLKSSKTRTARQAAAHRYANRSSEELGRMPIFLAYETRADHASGVAGGLGRLELAAHVLGVLFDERLCEPATFAEVQSLDHGLGGILARAVDDYFDVLVVSEFRSLGCDLSSALQLYDVLTDLRGQTVYVATVGFVIREDVVEAYLGAC